MPVPPSSSGYKWKEISDLPTDAESLRDRELESLAQVWTAEKERLDAKSVEDFNARLAREWAIETGIIENVYTLTRGITQALIERGIDSAYIPHDASDTDSELVARIIQAHADVLEGLFAFVTGERELSTGYIKELHAALLRHQEKIVVFDQFGKPFETQLEKGLYKRLPNNPNRADGTVHEYAPPEHVSSEMDRLIAFYQQHDQHKIPPHAGAAWIHHTFTQIHPFQEGNGRVARALASLVFIERGFFPLVVNRDDRDRYIAALEAADHDDLSHLVRLFSQIQKRSLTKAISGAVDTTPVTTVEGALNATRDLLVNLGRIIPIAYLAAKETAGVLVNVTLTRFNHVTATLTNDIARVNSEFTFQTASLAHAPVNELKAIAEKLHYDPNTNDHHTSLMASFKSKDIASRVVVSFHSVGPAFRGLLVAVAYFQTGDRPPTAICDDVFRINYQESRGDIVNRYSPWLEECLIKGLAEWRRTLA